MSAKAETAVLGKGKIEQIVTDFDAETLKAPFLLRCGALLIDYILLLSVPTATLLIGRFSGYDGAKLLNNPMNNVSWLIMILLALTNFVILPMFSGQSLGKMFTGLRIVNTDGTFAGFTHIIRRNVFGYLLTLCTGFLGFLMSAFNAKGRTLHDIIGGTVVIYGNKVPKAIKN
jgi:uncharacterized RDD family membrane protein YckC